MKEEREETIEVCECEHTHKNVVEKVKKMMPSEDVVYDVAELFKVFGDSTRTNILMALFESEMCVCDIGGVDDLFDMRVRHAVGDIVEDGVREHHRFLLNIADAAAVILQVDIADIDVADGHVAKIFEMAIEHVAE